MPAAPNGPFWKLPFTMPVSPLSLTERHYRLFSNAIPYRYRKGTAESCPHFLQVHRQNAGKAAAPYTMTGPAMVNIFSAVNSRNKISGNPASRLHRKGIPPQSVRSHHPFPPPSSGRRHRIPLPYPQRARGMLLPDTLFPEQSVPR